MPMPRLTTTVYPYSMFNVIGPPDLRWFVSVVGEVAPAAPTTPAA